MPKLFLSSTIRDFADMRSAIKYWLEENGFEVLASEWPDFPHALDREAVAAALAPIGDCDYYLLLIGRRVGTLTTEDGISVTRAEFRHARETRRRTGKPQMLHLLRGEIATARRVGRPQAIDEDDWPAILSFIDEVEGSGDTGDPNWLRKFESFRDVVDVLRATLHISGPLVRRALEANLGWEIRENTRELLYRGEAGLQPQALWFPDDVSFPQDIMGPVTVSPVMAYGIFRFRLSLPRAATLSVAAIEESINSGQFLDYDARANAHVVGPFHRCLLQLRQEMRSLDGLVDSINKDETISRDMTKLAEATRIRATVNISSFTGRMLYGAWSTTMNVLKLNRAIYRVLVGVDAEPAHQEALQRYATDEASKMRAEAIMAEDADAWLRAGRWRLKSPPG